MLDPINNNSVSSDITSALYIKNGVKETVPGNTVNSSEVIQFNPAATTIVPSQIREASLQQTSNSKNISNPFDAASLEDKPSSIGHFSIKELLIEEAVQTAQELKKNFPNDSFESAVLGNFIFDHSSDPSCFANFQALNKDGVQTGLIVVSKLPNPNFPPEISVLVGDSDCMNDLLHSAVRQSATWGHGGRLWLDGMHYIYRNKYTPPEQQNEQKKKYFRLGFTEDLENNDLFFNSDNEALETDSYDIVEPNQIAEKFTIKLQDGAPIRKLNSEEASDAVQQMLDYTRSFGKFDGDLLDSDKIKWNHKYNNAIRVFSEMDFALNTLNHECHVGYFVGNTPAGMMILKNMHPTPYISWLGALLGTKYGALSLVTWALNNSKSGKVRIELEDFSKVALEDKNNLAEQTYYTFGFAKIANNLLELDPRNCPEKWAKNDKDQWEPREFLGKKYVA